MCLPASGGYQHSAVAASLRSLPLFSHGVLSSSYKKDVNPGWFHHKIHNYIYKTPFSNKVTFSYSRWYNLDIPLGPLLKLLQVGKKKLYIFLRIREKRECILFSLILKVGVGPSLFFLNSLLLLMKCQCPKSLNPCLPLWPLF